ncbi:toll/interleukin-1 receptor-like protein [Gossypium australe]|uniref:ADP-ribosyl cyclase/cyclic ADP-ribose hydrolase n=1 Tax=Gossypium australe TaxID=47621 RepID=A0A5B6WJS8_9ROSI|nr:toll/interleukin-1 receptor-like protein [Gossypium australe]
MMRTPRKVRRDGGNEENPPCSHYKITIHSKRPDIQCRSCKQFGHTKRVCKNKGHIQQQNTQAQIVEVSQEEFMFAVSCEAQFVFLMEHQVFLSFSSKDMWHNFTNHHLKAMKDMERMALPIGAALELRERLSPALSRAIAHSNVSISILFVNYASSKSCLAEVSDIMRRKDTQGHFVLPIFFIMLIDIQSYRLIGGGEDTRLNFTAHLLKALKDKGLNVYFDEEALEKGEQLSQALSRAISASILSIIILSVDYASSKPCLAELVDIMHCKDTQGHIVLPIFYHVDPSDVRNLGGSFKTSFDEHESNRLHQVQQWKAAFAKVGILKGWHIEGGKFDRPETEYIKDIVEYVTKKLMSTQFRNYHIWTARMKAHLEAQEQRRLLRSERTFEGALPARVQSYQADKGKKKKKEISSFDSSKINRETKSIFPPCKHCGKKGHPPFKCWKRPDQQCEKCQKMGHHQKICKSNFKQKRSCTVTCFATSSSNDKEQDTSIISKV